MHLPSRLLVFKDNSSKPVSPGPGVPEDTVCHLLRITVNNASHAGLQTGRGKGDKLTDHPNSTDRQTKGKENVGW